MKCISIYDREKKQDDGKEQVCVQLHFQMPLQSNVTTVRPWWGLTLMNYNSNLKYAKWKVNIYIKSYEIGLLRIQLLCFWSIG